MRPPMPLRRWSRRSWRRFSGTPPWSGLRSYWHGWKDEAVDALRDLPDEDRRGILEVIPAPRAAELSRLLGYPEGVVGGIMTTNLVVLSLDDTIEHARRKALEHQENQDLQGLVVVDAERRLVDDLPLLDLLAAR